MMTFKNQKFILNFILGTFFLINIASSDESYSVSWQEFLTKRNYSKKDRPYDPLANETNFSEVIEIEFTFFAKQLLSISGDSQVMKTSSYFALSWNDRRLGRVSERNFFLLALKKCENVN